LGGLFLRVIGSIMTQVFFVTNSPMFGNKKNKDYLYFSSNT